MLIFFIIFNFAGQVAMEIATEKTSRVIEMIITSVSPVVHILAKIAAVIAVAFTRYHDYSYGINMYICI